MKKKPSRNAPCHCGSGKKYKKCHMKSDQATSTHNFVLKEKVLSKDVESPEESSSNYLSDDEIISRYESDWRPIDEPTTIQEPELDPLIEEFNALVHEIESAEYEQKWQLIEAIFEEHPALVADSESVFEFSEMFYHLMQENDDQRRFLSLLERFLNTDEAHKEHEYLYDWAISVAVQVEDWTLVDHYFGRFSEIAGDYLDTYYRKVSQVAYYRPIEIVLAGMRAARPSVKVSREVIMESYGEFCTRLGSFEIAYLASVNPQLTVEDETLQARFTEYELTSFEDFAEGIAYATGRKQPQWQLETDFSLNQPSTKSNDPLAANIIQLADAFTFYAINEANVSLAKVILVQRHLIDYLNSCRQPSRKSRSNKRSNKRGGKRISRSKVKKETILALAPTSQSLSAYISETMLDFWSMLYYDITAWLELIPVWLEFLARYELSKVDPQTTIAELKSVVGENRKAMQDFSEDKHLARVLAHWPDNPHSNG